MKYSLFIATIALLSQSAYSQKITERNFQAQFSKHGVDGCFVLFDESDNAFIRYNPGLCDTGYIPASTFKIPHALIALEEGIVKDPDAVIQWDGHEWPNKPWNQDQTLRTSMKYSCVWVYTGFAAQIGIEKYHSYVNSFAYGNKDLTGPPTRFWLAGLFRISANQQIDFLRRFYHAQLPVSRRSIDIVKDMIVLEQTDSWKLSGKTGGGRLTETDNVMWLVGYLEKDSKPYFYALNFKTNDFDKLAPARYEIVKDILGELGLIETDMVLIPKGEFIMGKNTPNPTDWQPEHRVEVNSFYLDKFEVTNRQYEAFCRATGHALPEFWGNKVFKSGPDFPDHPVTGVSSYDAESYAKWAGKRLPTEAEWEYASRGGLEGRNYPFGDQIDSTRANYGKKFKGILKTGSFQPNGFGLYDMSGNVWEWVSDNYDGNYYAVSPALNPRGPERSRFRVIRGGSWHSGAMCLQNYYRNGLPASWVDFAVGFRCAKDL